MDEADISTNSGKGAAVRPGRKGILVLGMHRSGTSACARVLNLLGCALPERLIGPGSGNEAGHWESADAVYLNDKILASAGSSWSDWGPINDDWRRSAIQAEMIVEVRAVVKDHCQLGPLFAIKDPRLCRLADIWFDAMRDEYVDPLALVMLRNPVEVSASLEHRDLMTPGYGQLMWLRHVLDAELLSRGQRRVFCRYDQLMGNWQGMIARVKHELEVAFPRNSQTVHAEIDAFLSSDRRHHQELPERVISNPGLSEWLRRTFAIMLAWSEQGEDSKDHAELDGIREEFDRAYGTFARLLLSGDAAGRLGSGARLKQELTTKLAEAEQATEAARQAVSEAESHRIAAETREAELKGRLSELERTLPDLRAETEKERAGRAEAERLLAAAHGELEKRQSAEADLTGRLATLESTLAQREEELAQLWTKADEAESAARAAEERHQQELAQRAASEQEAVKLKSKVAELEATLPELRAEIEKERAGRAEADRLLAAAEAELERQQAAEAELTGRLATLESTLVQRKEELAQLLSQFHEAERGRLRAETDCEHERELRVRDEQHIQAMGAEIKALHADLEQAYSDAKKKADALTTDLAQLTVLLQKQEEATEQAGRERADSAAEAARLSEEVRRLNEAVSKAEANRAELESKLGARFDELARLTSIAAMESDRAEALESRAKWLTAMRRVEDGFPAWWAIMPLAWRMRREHRRYHRAGLFDANAYLALYPDVVVDGMDPVRHYILHGMAEGRNCPVPS